MTSTPEPTAKVETFRDRQNIRFAIIDGLPRILGNPKLPGKHIGSLASDVEYLQKATQGLERPHRKDHDSELGVDAEIFSIEERLTDLAKEHGVEMPAPVDCFSRRQIQRHVAVESAELPSYELLERLGPDAEDVATVIQRRGDAATNLIEALYKTDGATPEEEAAVQQAVDAYVEQAANLIEGASKLEPRDMSTEPSTPGSGIEF